MKNPVPDCGRERDDLMGNLVSSINFLITQNQMYDFNCLVPNEAWYLMPANQH